ncbi:division/cell wall cluster transcriptional repressor MraZ [Parvularcula dongshanensis]|uniref:Transcriptional regulator MraZ n=1 Tax=Parvularcula dongshanensis TaxID=1173995 RepID=A0A840I514_9PROT|nr:hypothetical protein [Parvularcula dongshanensis]MBB4659877.1 MraZ protein [Parvularcula dongshanensis]
MQAVATERGGEAASARSAARFVGRAECKVDAKGRVSVPADFRRALGEGEPLYAFASLTDPVIECGGADLVGLLLSVVSNLDVYDEDRWAMEEAITEETQRLAFDDNGRIVLPPSLREHAVIEGQASFAGRGQRFVLAAPSFLADRRSLARAAAARHRDTLKARTLPSVVEGRRG